MKKRLIAAVFLVLSLSACSAGVKDGSGTAYESREADESTEENTVILDTESEASPDQNQERVEKDGMISSYLTGEMKPVEIAERRPVAVMMSNDKEARPQYGINAAGIVYEAPVEGTMNRYMALIEDYDELERIGSVRSCRTYYTYFAREWDAVYAHVGQSSFAKPYLKNVDNINGLEGIGNTAFYRSRDKKAPHNAYTSGSRLKESIEKLGYRTGYAPEYKGHFKFNSSDVRAENSIEAYKLYPGYQYNKPWFEYNEAEALYYRYQYSDRHMGDKSQIAVKNIIFQYAPIGHYASTAYLNINVHQDSYGYYISDGAAIPVSVKKDGEFGITRYYDAEGREISLNKGKTWICIIDSAKFKDTEIYDKNGGRTNN